MVGSLSKQQFAVSVGGVTAVSALIAKLQIAPQELLRRARLGAEGPNFRSGGESGFRPDTVQDGTSGSRGQTPVLYHTRQRL